MPVSKSSVSATPVQDLESKVAQPPQPRKKGKKDFPLFRHATGRWAKKIRGKFAYFGKVATDPDGKAALALYLDQRDELLAGRKPRKTGEGTTVKLLCDSFYSAKLSLLKSGEISHRTLQQYDSTCERIVRVLGRARRADDLGPEDFDSLRADITKTLGPVSTGNEINRCRCVFRYAFDQGLIPAPVRYGQSFKRPNRKTLRVARAANGERMLEARELRKVIYAADPVMRAMVLLAINGGLGQTDLSLLPQKSLNLRDGWLDYPRPKTGVSRRIPLWSETVAAVHEALALRPTPKSADDADLVFITKYGHRWVRLNKKGTPDDSIGKEFAKLLRELALKRPGLSFYALRHTFRTVADDTRDFPAIDGIMGHSDESMAARYRERIDDERLRAVVDYVHRWLFPRPWTA
jgi:integrase